MKALASLALAVVLAASGCAGDDPAPGVSGADALPDGWHPSDAGAQEVNAKPPMLGKAVQNFAFQGGACPVTIDAYYLCADKTTTMCEVGVSTVSGCSGTVSGPIAGDQAGRHVVCGGVPSVKNPGQIACPEDDLPRCPTSIKDFTSCGGNGAYSTNCTVGSEESPPAAGYGNPIGIDCIGNVQFSGYPNPIMQKTCFQTCP